MIRRWLCKVFRLIRPESVWITVVRHDQIISYTTLEQARLQAVLQGGVAGVEFSDGLRLVYSEMDIS